MRSLAVKRLQITPLSLQCLVSRNTTKRFTAHRSEETICCYEHDCSAVLSFHYLWFETGGYFFFKKFQHFVFMADLLLCK